MEHNGVTSKAKEVAEKEVFSRVVTLEQAKEEYKNWIERGLEIGGFEEKTIDFWKEVSNQVDKINYSPTGPQLRAEKAE